MIVALVALLLLKCIYTWGFAKVTGRLKYSDGLFGLSDDATE
ncbi:hypothetical protein [Neisseria sp. 74A18]|nr:hypothetical protein [Neisseria sp. 74A18]